MWLLGENAGWWTRDELPEDKECTSSENPELDGTLGSPAFCKEH